MNPPFNLRELRCFVALAEQKGRVSAASSLQVSPQVLAQTIARLESRLRIALFERGPQGSRLTDPGEAFYEKALGAVRSADAAVAAVGPWARGESRVRLGFHSSAETLARPLRQRFAQQVPKVEIEAAHLRRHERLAALREGRIDVELTHPAPRGRDLVTAPLVASPRYAVLPEHHPLAARGAVRFAEIAGSSLVGECDFAARRANAQYTPSAHGDLRVGLDRVWALVYSGKAVGVLPRFMLPPAVGDGVRAVPLLDVEPLEVVLVRRREDERSAVAALLELASPAADAAPREADDPRRAAA